MLYLTDELKTKGIAGDVTGGIIDLAREMLTDPMFFLSFYLPKVLGSADALEPAYGKGMGREIRRIEI